MKGLYAVYRKEMSHYFVSPIAYIIGGVFLFLTGFFFTRVLSSVIEQAFEMGMQSMQFGGGMNIDVPSQTLRYFFGILSSILLFLTPMLTMGVYAEERKRGTIELLMTSPITDFEIVLGKFLASLSLLVILLLPTAVYSIFMFLHSEPAPPWKVLVCAYLGALLIGERIAGAWFAVFVTYGEPDHRGGFDVWRVSDFVGDRIWLAEHIERHRRSGAIPLGSPAL